MPGGGEKHRAAAARRKELEQPTALLRSAWLSRVAAVPAGRPPSSSRKL